MAAETVLLVSEQRMKEWTSLDNNIRIDVLTPSILNAQEIYIQDTLGTPFFNRLKEGVRLNDLTTAESDFLRDYVGPTLMQYALYLIMPNLKYKFVEKGIVTGASEETTGTSLEELKYLIYRDEMTYGSTRIVEQTVTQTAQHANKKTDINISKLKIHMSKDETKTRHLFK